MQKTIVSFLSSIFSLLRLLYWYGEALFRYFVPPPMSSLDGETILVTGGASGIGAAICRYLVESSENIKLVIWDVNRRGAESLAKDLRKIGKGLRVHVYEVDISSKENIQRTAKLVKKDVGPVTVVVNNAGIAPIGKFVELTDFEIEQTMQINLMSQLWILREFLGTMMSNNYGRILNICSAAGLSAGHCALPYCASKFGMNGYSEALKAEMEYFGYDGIHVTTVFPSATKTPIIRSLTLVAEELEGMPESMKKFLEPEDVAKQAVDGMRRGLEFVYCPQFVGVLPYNECLFPMKQRKAMRAGWVNKVKYTDPEDQKKFEGGRRSKTN